MPTAVYDWKHGRTSYAHSYLLPAIDRILQNLSSSCPVFDLGCGNGALATWLSGRGYVVSGVDPSEKGIAFATADNPGLRLEVGSSDEDLADRFGQFPIVFSLEVVEHVYSPERFARCLFDLLEPGGTAIVSTPYHGYWKNVAIALAGGFDRHVNPLWEGGHIKFWSTATLTDLLIRAGFTRPVFHRVGRIPPFAKSMIAVARRPHVD